MINKMGGRPCVAMGNKTAVQSHHLLSIQQFIFIGYLCWAIISGFIIVVISENREISLAQTYRAVAAAAAAKRTYI
jgi:hypothetical protein